MSTSNAKTPIFQVLSAINEGSSFFDDRSDEDLKTLHPYVLTRWLAGSNAAPMIAYLNDTQNVYNASLYKHKRLLFRLLQTTRGTNIRAKWMAPPGKTKQDNQSVKVIQESLQCSKREALLYLESVDADTIVAEAERLGWQKDEIKKLKQELA